MIVRLEADGAVVADADDCSAVHVQTTLAPNGLRAALLHTGTGSVPVSYTHLTLPTTPYV